MKYLRKYNDSINDTISILSDLIDGYGFNITYSSSDVIIFSQMDEPFHFTKELFNELKSVNRKMLSEGFELYLYTKYDDDGFEILDNEYLKTYKAARRRDDDTTITDILEDKLHDSRSYYFLLGDLIEKELPNLIEEDEDLMVLMELFVVKK